MPCFLSSVVSGQFPDLVKGPEGPKENAFPHINKAPDESEAVPLVVFRCGGVWGQGVKVSKALLVLGL